MRSIEENSPFGTTIGGPVEATDTNTADNTRLTYAVSGTHSAMVSIDQDSGQLSVRTLLDHETTPTLQLRVTATDPSALTATKQVTVTVTDVDETPSLAGPQRVRHLESGSNDVALYRVRNAQERRVQWSLSSQDADQFQIDSNGALRFVDTPDHENPTDHDNNAEYDVTIEADVGTHTLSHNVDITVVNEDEPGSVMVEKDQPVPGDDVTATLTDPDGGINDGLTEWEWQRSRDRRAWTPIPGADTDTYTIAEHDLRFYMRVVAVYDDSHGNNKSASFTTSRSITTAPTSTRTITRGREVAPRIADDGEDTGPSAVLVVANGWSPADIGAAVALSARTADSAVAYVTSNELPVETLDLLRERRVSDVVIVGGESAVRLDVQHQIRRARAGLKVERVEGSTRAGTAAAVARRILGENPSGELTLILANGWSPPDIGVAAALSARTAGSAVAYTAPSELPAATRNLVSELQPRKVIIVGGAAAVPIAVEQAILDASPRTAITRVDGETRVTTAILAAQLVFAAAGSAADTTVIVANGWSSADIGVAAAWSARTPDSAVVYTSGTALPPEVAALLGSDRLRLVRIVGGVAAVSAEVRAAIDAAVADGTKVQRINGTNRSHTAALVARLGLPRHTN